MKSFALNIQSSFSAPNYLEENINIFKWLKSISILGEVIFLILSWGVNRRAFKICRPLTKTLYDSLNQMQKSREFADFYKIKRKYKVLVLVQNMCCMQNKFVQCATCL